MSTFHEEAAMAHGSGNDTWCVEFHDHFTGEYIQREVSAVDEKQAINKATYRLNTENLAQPIRQWLFYAARVVPRATTNPA